MIFQEVSRSTVLPLNPCTGPLATYCNILDNSRNWFEGYFYNVYFQRDKLEQTMDETQKEMNKLRSERDEAVRQHTAIDSRVNDLQVGKDRGVGGW